MVHNVRSNVLQRIFPDEYMLQAFGKLNPSRSERTVYFFEKWCDWHNNKIKISHLSSQKLIRNTKYIRSLGRKRVLGLSNAQRRNTFCRLRNFGIF